MNTTKTFFLLLIISFLSCKDKSKVEINQPLNPSPPLTEEHQKVFDQLKINDELLFGKGFNQCDTNQFKALVSEDFEFYHDQSGITPSKAAFIQSIKGICTMSYKPTRELVKNSLEVHLLKNNGKLYGAIQNGQHEFYGEEEGRPKYLTSTADFTHLWILEKEDWKLKRVLSYNHQVPEEN